MAGLFQPKRVKVPGLVYDEQGFAVGTAQVANASKDVAQSQVPTSAVEFSDKVVQLGQQNPGPKLKLPARARSIAGAADNVSEAQRSDKIGNALAGAVQNTVAGSPFGPGLLTLATLGTITDPAEQAAEKQRQIDAATADEKAVKIEAEEAARLRALSDDEFFAETGVNPRARSLGGTPEAAATSDLAAVMDAEAATKAAKEGPLPTQTWWLNSAQVAARSAAQMGTSALKAPVDLWELTAGRVANGGDIKNSEVGVWLDGVDKAITKLLPGDPSRSKEFLSELSAGAGSMAGFMIAGFAGRAVGVPAGWASGVLGAATEANQMYEEAEDFGAVGLQKYLAFILGAGLGATEAAPIDRAFMRADIASGGMVRKLLQNTTATTLEEFLQEYGQTMGEDLVAKYWAGYDPDRKLDPGSWLKAGVIGGITGAAVGASTTVLEESGLTPKPVEKVDDAQVVGAVDAALAAGEQRFSEINGADLAAETPSGEPGAQGEVPAPTGKVEAGAKAAVPRPDPVRGDAIQRIVEQPEQIVAPQFDASAITEVIDAADLALEGEGAEAITDFVGHPAKPTAEHGIMDARKLEAIARGENPSAAAQIETAFQPIREALRAQVGDTIRLYRVQRPVKREDNVLVHGMPEDGRRAALSWSSNPKFARDYAGVGKDRKVYSEDEIAAFEKTFAAEGQVKIGRHWLVKEDSQYPVIYPDRDGKPALNDMVTDTDSVRDYVDTENEWASEDNARNAKKAQAIVSADVPLDDIIWITGRANQSEFIVRNDPARPVYINERGEVRDRTPIDAVQLAPSDTSPLPNLEKGLTGPIPTVVKAAKAYAAAAGIPHRRAREYVKVDVARASRIAQAYADMKHEPADPAVAAAYKAMAEETLAQYRYVLATGLKIESMKEGQPDPYPNGPRDVLKDIASGHIWYFPTKFGFGSDATFDPSTNPLLEETEFLDDTGTPMLVNDVFRVVHDFFGHGLEGSGFGARGEENAWQSHMRLYSASAVPAMTSETRGQNSWVNYGPHGEHNRANPRDTVYADQKTGIMPSWTWEEGLVDSTANDLDAPTELRSGADWRQAVIYQGRTYVGDSHAEILMDMQEALGLDDAAFDAAIEQMREGFVDENGFFTNTPKKHTGGFGHPTEISETFRDAFAAAKAASPYGAAAHIYDDYSAFRTFLTPDGLSGFALDGENIVSVFSHPNAPRGRLRKIIDVAVANGGRTLDAFDGNLVKMYSALGFRETSRVQFDRSQAPKDWPYDKLGTPDIVFMEYGQNIERMEQREDALQRWHKDAHEYFKNEDGSPKVFYHGTEKGGFRVFETKSLNRKTQGTGAWFTPQRHQATTYGSRKDIELYDAYTLARELVEKNKVTIYGDVYTLQQEEDGLYVTNEDGFYPDGPYTEGELPDYLSDVLDGQTRDGVYSVYLNPKNPVIVDWGGADWTDGPAEQVWRVFLDGSQMQAGPFYDRDEAEQFARDEYERLKEGTLATYEPEDFTVEEVTEPGYQTTDQFVREVRELDPTADAVVLRNVTGSGPNGWGNDTGDEVVIFEPTNIKSTANIGTYSPSDPDIMRMVGTATTRQPYKLEPTRPTKGIPLPANTTTSPALADVRLTAISKQFIKALDLTARQGRLAAKNRNVMGEYNRSQATVRLRTWTDFATLVHEGGHALNDMHAQPMDDFTDRNRGEISKIAYSLYGGDLTTAPIETVLREGFAEFFRVYSMTPDYARNRWGALTADFENTLDAADPKLRSNLNVIAGQFKAWLQLPSSQLVENMVVDGKREQGLDAAIKEIREAGFHSWFNEVARRGIEWSVNRYAPLNALVTDLLNQAEENRGVPLDLKRSDDPRVIMRLARNAGSRAQIEMVDGIIGYRSTQSGSRGLREAMLTALGLPPDTTPRSLDQTLLKSFDAYLVSRRALDEWRRYEAGEIDRPPTGAQKGDHVRHARETERQYPQFKRAAEIVHEYGMALWQKRYEAGLMDKDTYLEGKKRQFYAPLQRDVSDKQGDRNSLSFGASALTKGPRFKGSDRDIVSPMTVLMQMTFAVERQIAENDAKKALAILADRAGAAGKLVERIPASQIVGQTFSVEQVAQRLTADTDLSAVDAADLMAILEGSVEQGDTMTLYRAEQAGAQGENVIFFWENGKVSAIRLTEKSLGMDVVNLMNGLGRENMDITMELIAGTSGVFRTAITKWPDFLIVNYIRDQMSAWVLNDVGFVPFVSGMKGMAEEIRQKQWAKSYNVAGGVMGGMNVAAMHKARVDRDITALRAKGYVAQAFGEMDGTLKGDIAGAIRGFSRITELSETGTRLGLYQKAFERAKRDGLNDYEASIEAAYIATDYIDFGLNGSKMLTSRRIIPFLNAQLQGLYKMVRTLGATEVAQRKGLKFVLTAYFKSVKNLPLSRVEKQQLNAGRLAWVKMASLGLFSALLAMLFKDDPDYQEAGEYLRTTGWVVPIGDGKVFWLPKPFELALVANAVERGFEFASGDREAPGRFLRGAAMALTPPTGAPGPQVLTELSLNKDFFTGRDIVPDYMQALEPALQYDNYTSSLAKSIAAGMDSVPKLPFFDPSWLRSPMMLDHLMSGLGASAYRDTMTVFNMADPTRPSPDITDAPITRRFVRDVRRGSASAQDFWAQASRANGALKGAADAYRQARDAGNALLANRRLSAMDADSRAYAVLDVDFSEDAKRLNPFYRARQVTTLVSDMRREMASAEGLGDTSMTGNMTRKALVDYLRSGNPLPSIAQTAGQKQQIDDILSEIARREVRNTLIATKQPGWANGKKLLPLQPTLDMLLAVSPEVYDEYMRRHDKAKIYDDQAVYDGWPEVRDRLNADGPYAVLTDMIGVASAGL